MTRRSQGLLAAALIALLGLGGCAKGGTTLDEDADESAPGSGGTSSSDGSDDPCGNESIDEGEDCDGNLLNGVTCVNLGFTGGTLRCDPTTCMFDLMMCTRPASLGTAGDGS